MELRVYTKKIEKDIKFKLAEQSIEAIRNLINSAETARKTHKHINFHDLFLQEAKKHII